MRRELKLLLIERNLLRVEMEQLRAMELKHAVRGVPFGVRQSDSGEPRQVAKGSGTPPSVDRASAAMVAILVALC